MFDELCDADEKTLGKNHPSTLKSFEAMASALYCTGSYMEAEGFYFRALEGNEAQLGKDHVDTKRCAENLNNCLKMSGNSEKLAALKGAYP